MALFIAEEPVELEAPVFVLALDGWVDAGSGTALARAALLEQMDTHRFGSFDADALIDYRARRPTMMLADGVIQSLRWPSIEVRHGVDRAGNDVVVIHGPEPDTSWQAFCAEVVGLAQGYAARMVVGLGSFPAPVPHTRAVRLASTAATRALADQVGYVSGVMEVPCGIHAAIEGRCQAAGVPAVGIWARVPHYLAASTYPAAGAALVDGLAAVAGLTLQSTDLHAEAAAARIRIDGLVAESAEHRELVRQLEAQADSEDDAVGPAITATDPDTLQQGLSEIEEFLRDQNNK
ncbi:MAG TPA: PAC2 family protein [Acidimicrobiales bacterium]|nr:PAC2 family protein [Acidimicrobiales bacterium]